MSCNSAIYTVNNTAVTLATGTQIPLGSVVRRFGSALQLSGNNISVNSTGYYDVAVNATLNATAPGDFTITLYRNGTPVNGAVASSVAAAASDPVNLSIAAVVRRTCCCGDPDELALYITGDCTLNNVGVVVSKL